MDEISTKKEVEVAGTIAQRGVQLIATVHGDNIMDVINDGVRAELLGGTAAVTLSKAEAEKEGTRQTKLRNGTPCFEVVLEMRSRDEWFLYDDVTKTVDECLKQKPIKVNKCTPGNMTVVTLTKQKERYEETQQDEYDAQMGWWNAVAASPENVAALEKENGTEITGNGSHKARQDHKEERKEARISDRVLCE